MIYPIILAGGVGSRLWPLSRSKYPKQCLDIEGSGESLLQSTLNRAASLDNVGSGTIVCNEDHRFLVAEQASNAQLTIEDIILEPVGRNTAAAIAVAAWSLYKRDPKGVMLVLASDHSIKDQNVFNEKVQQAAERAELGYMMTFGIEPSYPETGYGYIKAEDDQSVSRVLEFVEKPNLDRARLYCESGNYLWNSGMFMFRVDSFLKELGESCPDIHSLSEQSVNQAKRDLDFMRLDKVIFERIESISIDYALMEKTSNSEVIRFPNIWSDVGSWSAICDLNESDREGNVIIGDVVKHDTKNCYINSNDRLVATIGVEDLIIVDTKDALLVAKKSSAQDVKKIVDILISQKRSEVEIHTEVYRPWGKYQTVDIGGRYQVKRITVKPQECLSLQMHHHRSEHWIVVTGTAKVRIGDEVKLVTENESTYIPLGEVHSLENPGMLPLELIEVQTGGYLGEDDIVRFSDRYGRISKENDIGK